MFGPGDHFRILRHGSLSGLDLRLSLLLHLTNNRRYCIIRLLAESEENYIELLHREFQLDFHVDSCQWYAVIGAKQFSYAFGFTAN